MRMLLKVMVVLAALAAFAATATAADNLKEMFSQGVVKGKISLLSYTRDFKNGTTDNRDTVLGGTLYYKTDSFKGISLGTAFGTTNDAVNEDDYNTYYGLTVPQHDNVTRLQEYYIQGDYCDTTVKVGAQEVHTPFLHIHPVRMINRTFRGVSLVNKSFRNLSLMGYYLTDEMDWVDEDFQPFNDDVYIAGVKYALPGDAVKSSVQAWYFTMADNLYQAWFNATFSRKVNDIEFHASPTYFFQQSHGDEQAGAIDTYQYGLNAGVRAYGFDLTAFYAKTGDQSIYDPWGYGKILIQQIVNSGDSFNGDREDEDAYAVKLAYDFGAVGAKGLSAYVFHGIYDAATGTVNETDYNLQYAFSDALSVRLRLAQVNTDSSSTGWQDLNDYRLYVTYRFGVGGKK